MRTRPPCSTTLSRPPLQIIKTSNSTPNLHVLVVVFIHFFCWFLHPLTFYYLQYFLETNITLILEFPTHGHHRKQWILHENVVLQDCFIIWFLTHNITRHWVTYNTHTGKNREGYSRFLSILPASDSFFHSFYPLGQFVLKFLPTFLRKCYPLGHLFLRPPSDKKLQFLPPGQKQGFAVPPTDRVIWHRSDKKAISSPLLFF